MVSVDKRSFVTVLKRRTDGVFPDVPFINSVRISFVLNSILIPLYTVLSGANKILYSKRVEIRYILQKTKVLPINEKNKPLHYYSPMQKIVKTSAVKQSFFGSAPAPSLQKIIQNVNNIPLQLIFSDQSC